MAAEGDLAEGQLLPVQLADGQRVCLARVDGEVFAVADCCTHAEYPLSEGSVEEGGRIECTLHGAVFDLRTGAVLEDPAVEPVRTYPVKIEEGGIFVGR